MLFCAALDNFASANVYPLALGEEQICSVQSPDFLFAVCYSPVQLFVCSLKPFAIVGRVHRDSASCSVIGHNLHLAWHSESRLFAVTTDKGFILQYSLLLDQSNSPVLSLDVCSPAFGLNLVQPLNFSFSASGCFKFSNSNCSISAICTFKDCWLVACVGHPELFERIILLSDGRMVLGSPVFIFPPERVVRLEYIEIVDLFIWQSENGHIYLKSEASLQTIGWNGIQLALVHSASSYALNVKYKLLAVYSEASANLTCYALGSTCEVKVEWEIDLSSSAVSALRWSGNWSVLLVELAGGKSLLAFEMFTFLGDKLEVKGSFNDSPFAESNSIFFGIGDTALWLFPKEKMKNAYSIPLAKLSSQNDNCSYTRTYPMFIQEDKISIARERENSLMSFETMQFPPYASMNMLPIRLACVSPCGSFVFLAGSRGFCLYLRHFGKWNVNKEDVLVIAAPSFSESCVFVAVNDASGQTCLRAYSIEKPDSLLVQVPLQRRIICTNSCRVGLEVLLVFLLDIDGCLLVYQFHLAEGSFFLSLRSTFNLPASVVRGNDAILASNMHIRHFKGQFRIFLLQNGVLSRLLVEFSPVPRLLCNSTLASGVYFFDTCAAAEDDSEWTLDEFVAFRGSTLGFAGNFRVKNASGIVVAANANSLYSISQSFSCGKFEWQCKNESISIPRIKHLLLEGKQEQAFDLLQSLPSPALFTLEVLFYQYHSLLLEGKKTDHLLSFFKNYPEPSITAAAAIRVARKIDFSDRTALFDSIAQNPFQLWNKTFDSGNFSDSLAGLILLEEDSHLEECCIRLIDSLIANQLFDQLDELVRFCGHLNSLKPVVKVLLWNKSLHLLRCGFVRSWNRVRALVPDYSIEQAIQEAGPFQEERMQVGLMADYEWADCFTREEISRLDDSKLDISLIREQSEEIYTAQKLGIVQGASLACEN